MCVFVILKEKNSTANNKPNHQWSFAGTQNLFLRPNKILPKAIFLRYHPQIWNTTSLDLWL